MKSRTAQLRARRPLVYLANDESHNFLLYNVAAESEIYSPVDWSTARSEPAFRVSMVDSTPLDTARVGKVMHVLFTALFPEKAAKFQYHAHNSRIGRIRAMAAAAGGSGTQMRKMNLPTQASNASSAFRPVTAEMEELMNRISGHTANAGRDMYDTSQLVDEINLMKAANESKFTDLNTSHEFSRDGSGDNPAVSVVRKEEGVVAVIKNKLSALPKQRLREPVGSARAVHRYNSEREALARPVTSVAGSASDKVTPESARTKRLFERPHPPTAAAADRIETSVEASPPRNKPRQAAASSPRRKWLVESRRTVSGKQCETCYDKTANYGVASNMFRKQWCKACGLVHGAVNSATARRAGGFTGYSRGARTDRVQETVKKDAAQQQPTIMEAFELCAQPGAKTSATTESQQEKSSNRSLVESDTEIVSAASTDDAEYDQWFSEWQQDEEGQH